MSGIFFAYWDFLGAKLQHKSNQSRKFRCFLIFSGPVYFPLKGEPWPQHRPIGVRGFLDFNRNLIELRPIFDFRTWDGKQVGPGIITILGPEIINILGPGVVQISGSGVIDILEPGVINILKPCQSL